MNRISAVVVVVRRRRRMTEMVDILIGEIFGLGEMVRFGGVLIPVKERNLKGYFGIE